MTKFTVKLKNILGLSYYRYELTSSIYNATIDSPIIITCKVTNTLGRNVSGKSIILYHDGESVGSLRTDSNGEAAWTITPDRWGLHDFNVGNTHCQIDVDGWRQLVGANEDSSFQFWRNKNRGKLILNGWNLTYNLGTTWTQFGGSAYANNIRPRQSVTSLDDGGTMQVKVKNSGIVYIRAISGTTSGAKYCQMDWDIRIEDL